VIRSGTAHGICLWFDADLIDGITFSSAPALSKTIYGQVFLPWLEAVPVHVGQRIGVKLQANLVGNEYVWQWETKMWAEGIGAQRHFRQSTFQGANFTPQALRSRAADFVPSLSEQGQADRWMLDAIDGKTSLQQVAEAASQRFPSLF